MGKKWRAAKALVEDKLYGLQDAMELVKQKSKERTVTLVYGARDEEHNEALVLKKILEGRKRR